MQQPMDAQQMQPPPAPSPTSYMQAIMGMGQSQGGGSQYLQTGTSDALIADMIAGRNPLREIVMRSVMKLFA
jgi:hypothetical protein